MKRMILLPIAALVIILAGCQDERVPALEKRIADVEAKMKTVEDKQQAKIDADSINEVNFKECVRSADDDYNSTLRLNGTKNSNGSIAIATSSLQQLQRQKQSKLEECKILYK
jgi:hypothetical protein